VCVCVCVCVENAMYRAMTVSSRFSLFRGVVGACMVFQLNFSSWPQLISVLSPKISTHFSWESKNHTPHRFSLREHSTEFSQVHLISNESKYSICSLYPLQPCPPCLRRPSRSDEGAAPPRHEAICPPLRSLSHWECLGRVPPRWRPRPLLGPCKDATICLLCP
jgi:hypothetical protein